MCDGVLVWKEKKNVAAEMVQKNNLCSTPKVHGGEKNVDIYKLFKSDSQKTKRQQTGTTRGRKQRAGQLPAG